MRKEDELKVFISLRDSTCNECKENLGTKAWVSISGDKAYCLDCSDLGHLDFLPSGNAALTRRSKKNSKIYAVVLKWSRPRKRYERQGLLVEEEALEKAEEECLEDRDKREIRNQRRREKEAILDKGYIRNFANALHKQYPKCPEEKVDKIAQHACQKYSGRIGRAAFAKEFDSSALILAAKAHVRHVETNYDMLLMRGYDRWEARQTVQERVETILDSWEGD